MELLDALQWRYATKKFDPAKKVAPELVAQIIEAAWLAPSSSGLQPYELFVITNQELKEKLVANGMNQQLITDASHLLVFAAWDNYTEARIDNIYAHTTTERGLPADRFKEYTDRLKAMYLDRPSELNFAHAARQAYISFGLALAAAAELRVDATPVEGFDSNWVDEVLQLKDKGLKSVTLLPLGYRDTENDWLVNQKKVRQPKSIFLTEIK